ncbi:MAG: hypothetical protein P8019_14945 [Gammaproteobacteria bacterium]
MNRELAERLIPALSVQVLSESGSELDNSIRTHAHNDRDRDYFLDCRLWRANVTVFCTRPVGVGRHAGLGRDG